LLRQSQSSRAIVVLGGGRGLGSVLHALRGQECELTVIVSIAYDEDVNQAAQERLTGRTVEDLRRSLEALTDAEEDALLRAIRRPLTVGRLGEQPLGNLVIGSVASAFGDYGTASRWLGEQLGIAGAVLPATTQTVLRKLEVVNDESSWAPPGRSGREFRRLRFASEQIETPAAAVAAIEEARWVVLAPGSLYRSVLSTAAVPALASALAGTRARVVLIANLEPGSCEAADTTGIDHLRALALHGVRVDVVLHDPSAALGFDPSGLESCGVKSLARALRSGNDTRVHDPARLRAVLEGMLGSRAGTEVVN
jgi:uncharacterized cofD-like protein